MRSLLEKLQYFSTSFRARQVRSQFPGKSCIGLGLINIIGYLLVRWNSRIVQNIAVVLTLLLVPYWFLTIAHAPEAVRGRVGVALVFLFTGVGHFIRTLAMTQMLPAWVPMRVPLVYTTGVFELLAAAAILISPLARYSGLVLCIFLLLVLPSNIYAALQRVDFGGHGAGPVYLLVRIPLQFFLIGWIYWFAVRQHDTAG